MAAKYFPAIVDRSHETFGVTFPDFPGCSSSGSTMDEALLSAEEALALHINGMIEDGDAIPSPTPLDRVERDPELENVAVAMVRAELPGKAVRFNATMDEGLLAQIDRAATARGMSRSGILAEAARKMLSEAA